MTAGGGRRSLMPRAAGIAALGLVGVVLGAAFATRTQIVEAVIRDRLAGQGIEEAAFAVARVGFYGLRIEDVRIGRQLSIASIAVSYTPTGLLRGRLDGLAVDGLEVDASKPWTGVLGVLGVLGERAGGGGGVGPAFALPPVRVNAARIRAARPEGTVTARLDGVLHPDLSAAFTAVVDGAGEPLAGHRLAVQGVRAEIAVEAGGAGAGVRLTGGRLVDLSPNPWLPPLEVTGTVDFNGAAVVFDLAAVREGGGRLSVNGVHHLEGDRGTATIALATLVFAAGGLQPADLVPAAAVAGTVTGEVSARATVSWEGGRYAAQAAAEVAGLSLSPGDLTIEGLSAVLRLEMASDGGDITAGLVDGRARLAVAGIEVEVAGIEATARLDAAMENLVFRARAATAGGRVGIVVEGRHHPATGRGTAYAVLEPVRFAAGGLQPADVIPVAAAAVGAVNGEVSGQASVAWTPTGLTGEALAEVVGLSLAAGGVPVEDLSAVLHLALADEIVLDVVGGRARLVLPGAGLEVAGIEATATLDAEGIGFELAGATVRDPGKPSWLAPLAITGGGRLEGPELTFRGRAAAAGGQAVIAVEGRHDLDTGQGEAAAVLKALRFEAGGLQPADLVPVAAAIGAVGAVTGEVSGRASVEWADGDLVAFAEAEVSGVSATFGELRIDGLSARLGAAGPGHGGELALDVEGAEAALAFAGREVRLQEAMVAFTLDPESGAIDIDLDGVTVGQGAGSPWLPPLAVHGTARVADRVVDFQGVAAAPGGAEVSFQGRHRLEDGGGEAAFRLAPLAFGPGGARPEDLLPALGTLAEVTGTVAGEADVRWREGDYDGTATVDLEGLSLVTGTIAVEGLSGTVHLDRLNPPTASTPQRLGALSIATAAADLERPVVEFRIEAGGGGDGPRVLIDRAEAGFAGGRLALVGAVIEPAAETHRVAVELSAIRLGHLMGLLDLQGVSGEGTVSGILPLEVRGQSVAVSGGRLESDGPGVLRLRSEAVKQALAAGGEEVAMVIEVLEDFRYRRLSLSVDKEFYGVAALKLGLEGHNPAVRDGHPFVLNIALEGNLDRLLAVVLEGYRLSDRAIRATLGVAR